MKYNFFLLTLIVLFSSCAHQGLLEEKYEPDFYKIPKLLEDGPFDHNPSFIVYGDNRPGYRLQEKFSNKENWQTWKMLLFPFYEIYWLGNGLYGTANWVRHKPGYGMSNHRKVRDAILSEIKQGHFEFLINIGDMPTDGRRPYDWVSFLKVVKHESSLVEEIPYIPLMGNHEHGNDSTYGLPNFQSVFDYPQFFVLDFPDVAIFFVDSDLILDQYQNIDDDIQDLLFKKWFVGPDSWLKKELDLRSQKNKIILMHHPPISFGKHNQNWTDPLYGNNLTQKKIELLTLFQKSGVRLIFSGHEHYYAHNIVRFEDREMHIVITGGGGSPLRNLPDDQFLAASLIEYKKQGLDVQAIKNEKVYHYCKVSVNSEEIEVEVFSAPGGKEKSSRLIEKIIIKNNGSD